MHSQLDTIGWSGSLAHENFRRPSSCSIHGKPSHSSKKSLSEVSIIQKLTTIPNQGLPILGHRRFNESFHYVRYIIVFLGGLAVGFMSMLRLSITVAILNMVNQTQIYLEQGHDAADLESYFGEGYEEVGEFDWNNEIQQHIISYYMIAYALPQLPLTKLAIRIGVRKSIPLCVGLCALSCLLTPVAAYQGWEYLVLLRLLNGLGASAILPMMVHLIEQWMPRNESSFGLSLVQFVQAVFFTSSPLISGYLASIHWKWAFYVPSTGALIYCIFWFHLVTDSPNECKFISLHELNTICDCENHAHLKQMQVTTESKCISERTSCSSLRSEDIQVGAPSGASPTRKNVPWCKVLRQGSFHALMFTWIFYQSSFGSLSFLIPIYMRQVLKVPITENGFLCFLIQCGCIISSLWPQAVLRQLENMYKLSLTQARRIVMLIICVVATATWLLIAAYHENQVLYLAVNRIFHLSVDTIVSSTIMTQYQETGFSSSIYSLINAVGSFSTVFFCMAAGEFLDLSGQSVQCWSWIFVTMCIMNVGILLLYSTVIKSEPIQFEKATNQSSDKSDCPEIMTEEGNCTRHKQDFS